MNSTNSFGAMRRYSQLSNQQREELSWFYANPVDVPSELNELAKNWSARRDTDVSPLIDHLRHECERAETIWKDEGKAAYEAELKATEGVWRRILVYVNAQQRRSISDFNWVDRWPMGRTAEILKGRPGRPKWDATPTMLEVVQVANMLTKDCDPTYRLERDKGVAYPVPQALREEISRHFESIGKKIDPTRAAELLQEAEWNLPRCLQ